MKNFVTVFRNFQEIHLIKDPGMIPYTMAKNYEYVSSVLLDNNETIENYLEITSRLKLIRVPSSNNNRIKKLIRSIWLFFNSYKIDVLNLYFLDKWTILNLFIYFLCNRHGKVYIHCDTDGDGLLKYSFNKNYVKKFILEKILFTSEHIDRIIWGIQNRKNANIIGKIWPFYNSIYVPDGYYWDELPLIQNDAKRNTIITIGRIGTKQKRTDVLLAAWEEIHNIIPKWSLQVVGPIEEHFLKYIDKYKDMNVNFLGNISSRKHVQKMLLESKIFCLTSDWESFGIAMVEALSCGCVIVCSNIPAGDNIISERNIGELFEKGNIDSLSSILLDLCTNEKKLENYLSNVLKYSNEYSWDSICCIIENCLCNLNLNS